MQTLITDATEATNGREKQTTTSRKKSDEEIHKHIRLQSAEELIKRVDTGFGQKTRAPFQAVVEGVQNSADAIDKAREALLRSTGKDDYDAEIAVTVNVLDKSRDELQLIIQDNGIGIPRGKVKIIVRAGGTGTVEYKASRSQQGIGWKAAAIYANQSTGKPLEIISKTFAEQKAHRHVYDYGKGKVEKIVEETYEGEFLKHGTRMILHLVGDYARAKANIVEFIKRMAAIHSYISFVLKENGTAVKYEKRSSTGIPIPKPVPPHPNSVDVGQLKDMLAHQSKIRSISLSGFLKRNFCRIGDKGVADLIERASILRYFDERGLFAGDVIKRVAQSAKLQEMKNDRGKLNAYLKVLVRDVDIDYEYATDLVLRGRLNPSTNIRALDNEELKKFFKLSDLLKIELPKPIFTSDTTVNMVLNDETKVRLLAETLRSMSFSVPPMDSLMPVPEKTLVEGFATIYKPEKFAYIERKPTSTRGRPVQVQVLAMYGGEIKEDVKEQDKLIRIANCTPLLYEFGSDIITQTARDIDWSIYKMGKRGSMPIIPVIFIVHVTSPQLKYLGVAKQAIGADDIISEEVKLALQAASRELKMHVNLIERSHASDKAREFLERYAAVVAETLTKMLRANKKEVYDALSHEIKKRRPVLKDIPVQEQKPKRTVVSGED